MIYETLTIGDLVVKNQVIGMGNQVDIPLLEDVTWDGILGLAYANANLKRLVNYFYKFIIFFIKFRE
jgi:hypothetical protein